MTDTPRTDAFMREIEKRAFARGHVNAADVFDYQAHARTLERELAELREMEDERTKELQSACADLAASTSYAGAQQARIDHLEAVERHTTAMFRKCMAEFHIFDPELAERIRMQFQTGYPQEDQSGANAALSSHAIGSESKPVPPCVMLERGCRWMAVCAREGQCIDSALSKNATDKSEETRG